jgi:hypothetical protein
VQVGADGVHGLARGHDEAGHQARPRADQRGHARREGAEHQQQRRPLFQRFVFLSGHASWIRGFRNP